MAASSELSGLVYANPAQVCFARDCFMPASLYKLHNFYAVIKMDECGIGCFM